MQHFLNIGDYQISATRDEMSIIADNEIIWQQAEQSAIEFVNTDITLWYLINRLPEFMGYDRREAPYVEARRLLEQVQKGQANIQLPTRKNDNNSQPLTRTRWGSMKKNRYDY